MTDDGDKRRTRPLARAASTEHPAANYAVEMARPPERVDTAYVFGRAGYLLTLVGDDDGAS